jgi:ABC-type multidrug transport system ATPase subunit
LTILLTTHDLDEAAKLCERIAIMDYGKILVNNNSAELKKMIPGGNALDLSIGLVDTWRSLRRSPGSSRPIGRDDRSSSLHGGQLRAGDGNGHQT